MKKFKNLVKVLSLFLVLVFAVSCSSKEANLKTKTFVLEKNGANSEITYYYDGDIVKKQTANNVIPYASIGVKTKEEAEKFINGYVGQYNGVKGIEYKGEHKDNSYYETLTVDYENLDYKKAKNLPGIMIQGDIEKSKGVSLSRSEELVKSKGYTEKK